MSRFDRFMVHVDIGTDEKLARLTDAERLCHIAGVLALAAKSPVRGRLLVGDHKAGPVEVARRAGVSERVAKSTVAKLIDVGVLTRDEEYDCWRVHNWERFNPEPRNDATNAERQARHRARNAARNAGSNGDVTPPEVEGEVEDKESPAVVTPAAGPVGAGKRTTDLAIEVCGILQRGIDGLTSDEPCKRPTPAAVARAIGNATEMQAKAAAIEARSIAQSQDRAPNIVALFAQKLSDALGEAAA